VNRETVLKEYAANLFESLPEDFKGQAQGIHREIGSEGFAPSPAGRPILRESIEGEFRARVASIEIIDETEYARRGGVVACTVEVAR
jgi:hypothetical protein